MYKIFTFILLFSLNQLSGQVTFQPKKPTQTGPLGVIYNDIQTIHFKLHTRGFAIGYDIGKIKTFNTSDFYTIELGYLRHPKEYRQSFRPNRRNLFARPIIYGKINNFIVLRALYKKKKFLSEKAEKNGIAIGYTYSFGLSMGFIKPYYILVDDNDHPFSYSSESIRYEESTEELFLDYYSIQGADSFFKGFGEIKFVPGISADASLVFSIGAFEEFARSIEAGIMIDAYPQVIPIMAKSKNSPYFINVYLNLYFGKRW